MITSTVRPTLGLVAAGAVLAIVACADSHEATVEAGEDAGSSKIATPPTTSEEAGVDAAADADASTDASVDAGPRTCSDDHFCHSVLPPDQALRGVWGDGTGIVWAISKGGSVLRWDGSAWTVHTTELGELSSIWGSGPTDIWVTGEQGLFHGTGATATALVFAPVSLPGDPAHTITSVWGTGPNDVWVVGGQLNDTGWPFSAAGRVLHSTGPSTDAGSDWAVDDLSSEPFAFGHVWGTPDGGVWVQGAGFAPQGNGVANVYRRKVGSTTWELASLPPDPSTQWAPFPGAFTTAGSSSASSVWLVGRTGESKAGYWHGTSADDGDTFAWTFAPLPYGALGLNAIWGLGVNDTWGVGPTGRLVHWNGTKWMQAATRVTDLPIAKSFYGIWGKSNDDFWVVGDDIALHKTTGNTP